MYMQPPHMNCRPNTTPLSLLNTHHTILAPAMSAIYSQPACAASSASLPPSYSASSASPPYTSQPTEQEQRLDYVAVPSTSRQHSGVFTKRTRRLAVTLSNQEDGIEAPVYARNALISGEIEIDEPSVLAISVKVRGRSRVATELFANIRVSSSRADRRSLLRSSAPRRGHSSVKATSYGHAVAPASVLASWVLTSLSRPPSRARRGRIPCHLPLSRISAMLPVCMRTSRIP